ncbi:hypothetical protein FACS1894120_5240 [Clostridia bacterium]|nr:hypothetical protein FACS1894120_5240 [Clostridia bacterium]
MKKPIKKLLSFMIALVVLTSVMGGSLQVFAAGGSLTASVILENKYQVAQVAAKYAVFADKKDYDADTDYGVNVLAKGAKIVIVNSQGKKVQVSSKLGIDKIYNIPTANAYIRVGIGDKQGLLLSSGKLLDGKADYADSNGTHAVIVKNGSITVYDVSTGKSIYKKTVKGITSANIQKFGDFLDITGEAKVAPPPAPAVQDASADTVYSIPASPATKQVLHVILDKSNKVTSYKTVGRDNYRTIVFAATASKVVVFDINGKQITSVAAKNVASVAKEETPYKTTYTFNNDKWKKITSKSFTKKGKDIGVNGITVDVKGDNEKYTVTVLGQNKQVITKLANVASGYRTLVGSKGFVALAGTSGALIINSDTQKLAATVKGSFSGSSLDVASYTGNVFWFAPVKKVVGENYTYYEGSDYEYYNSKGAKVPNSKNAVSIDDNYARTPESAVINYSGKVLVTPPKGYRYRDLNADVVAFGNDSEKYAFYDIKTGKQIVKPTGAVSWTIPGVNTIKYSPVEAGKDRYLLITSAKLKSGKLNYGLVYIHK